MWRSYLPLVPVRALPKPMSLPPVVVAVLNHNSTEKVTGLVTVVVLCGVTYPSVPDVPARRTALLVSWAIAPAWPKTTEPWYRPVRPLPELSAAVGPDASFRRQYRNGKSPRTVVV